VSSAVSAGPTDLAPNASPIGPAGDAPVVRPAGPHDLSAIVAMVHELAAYERAAEQCHLTEEQLRSALFGPAPALFGHVAVNAADEPVGFALWFRNFSTWQGVHGIYLEDLYVRPEYRRCGAGRALLATLAAICIERGYRRLEWSMLDWNPAEGFYRAIGAEARTEWVPYRLTGSALERLGATAGPVAAGPPGCASGQPAERGGREQHAGN
jgi:GNAT superfamily N-acetyltransferase